MFKFKDDNFLFRVHACITSVYGWVIDVVLALLVFSLFLFFLIRYADPVRHTQSVTVSDDVPMYQESVDSVFLQSIPDTGLVWTDPHVAYEQSIENPPALCELRKQYCNRVGHGYADFACDCFIHQYYDNFKTFTPANDYFSVYYPREWYEPDTSAFDAEFMSQSEFQIVRDNAACRITYGSLRMDALERMGSYSTTTVTMHSGEIRTIDVPFDGAVSDELAASGYTKWRAVAVPHFGRSTDNRGFLVSSGTQQPLLEACVSELQSIVMSRFDRYKSVTLDASSAGTVWLDQQIVWYKDDDAAQWNSTALVFEPADGGSIVQIAADVFARHQQLHDPLIVGSHMYFLDEGLLFSFNLFEDVERHYPLMGTFDQPVHAYMVRDSWIYYLQGDRCDEYMSKCSLNLRRYNPSTFVDELLAQEVSSREMLGFDGSDNMLYMSWAEGDAGCTWGSIESYDIARGVLADVGEYGYCYDSEDTVDDPDGMAFQEKIASQIEGISNVNHVILSGDGTIRVPEDSEWRDDLITRSVSMRAVK